MAEVAAGLFQGVLNAALIQLKWMRGEKQPMILHNIERYVDDRNIGR